MPKKTTIYLDNAATTQIDPLVLKAMLPYLKDNYGNASSIHSLGQLSRAAIEKARKQAADFLHCQEAEIYFTPSATFSDNLAILGIVKAFQKPHIITTQIEHPAVLEACKHLEKTGGAEITFLPVSKEGLVATDDVKKALKENTCLVSIMFANNEVGTIQPIAEIAKVLPKEVLFHTDAVQAANYLDLDVNKLGVNLLTLSGHKIYGPKGIGILYIKKGMNIEPLVFGGHQENGLSAGTENVANIVGMGKALELIKDSQGLEKLRDKLITGILEKIPQTSLNGSREKRLPNNANLSFEGVEGEALLILLDRAGVQVSTGSACSSGSLDPSHVLMALGLGKARAHSAIRFTLGKQTKEKEIDEVLKVLPEMVAHLRQISGFKLR